jgi:chromate reductase, NAD(P)H dehydrogenase (quinone)
MAVHVLAISGSLRQSSYNTRLLRAAATLLPPVSELQLWDSLKDIPPFDEDDEAGRPHIAVARLRDAVARADAILIATPEYNSSVPGQLKNALDWLSRPYDSNPLRGKPAAVIGASPGIFGAIWGQAETRKVLAAIGARTIDRELPIGSASEQFDAAGRLLDGGLTADLRDLLDGLVRCARLPAARTA